MRKAGFTLLEAVVCVAMFALLAVVLAVVVAQANKVWRNVSSRDKAATKMRLALRELQNEMASAKVGLLGVQPGPDRLGGGGANGDVLWFLSATDPGTGNFARTQGDEPFWQRNVIYYLAIPSDHDQRYGHSCTGGAGSGGYDDRCPHKVLIRKVVDEGRPTDTVDEDAIETLLSDPTPYLTAPGPNFDASGMASETDVESAQVIASELLWFRVRVAPAGVPNELELDFRAVALRDAERSLSVGTAALETGRFTVQHLASVLTHN